MEDASLSGEELEDLSLCSFRWPIRAEKAVLTAQASAQRSTLRCDGSSRVVSGVAQSTRVKSRPTPEIQVDV